jgi:NAD(P)-dependent dehydrogenase (short-subunit alcohol dehydrogenase family)
VLIGPAAKLSQVGFTETLAKEGYKYNILANVIAPIGKYNLIMLFDLLP